MHAGHEPLEWPAWSLALAYGLSSGLSFPIGATWGAWSATAVRGGSGGSSPKMAGALEDSAEGGGGVEDGKWSAATLAFGAGCLLFAVTVEMYGQGVAQMEANGYVKEIPFISTTIVSAMFGAWAYIQANRWVVKMVSEGFDAQPASPGAADEETPLWRKQNSPVTTARRKSLLLGYASWFGVLVSGIPEGVLLGQLVAVGQPSTVLVVSLLISNFPAAFASASLMKHGGKSNAEIISAWSLVFLLTGFLAAALPICMPAALSAEAPTYVTVVGDVLEGLAGGSMMASILALMLPEAYIILGDFAGLMATAGFLFAMLIKVFGGVITEEFIETTEMATAPPPLLAPHQ